MTARQYSLFRKGQSGLSASFSARIREPNRNDIKRHLQALEVRGDEDDGGRLIPVLISTTARARDGHVIADWELDHYRKHNPVVLWGHDKSQLPVGKSPIVDWDPELGELRALAQFAPKDLYPFGWQIGEMVARGYLNQPSVGFDILKASAETDQEVLRTYPNALMIHLAELTEFSVVNVEADTTSGFGRAVKRARAEGMDLGVLRTWAARNLDERVEVGVSRETLEEIALNGERAKTWVLSSDPCDWCKQLAKSGTIENDEDFRSADFGNVFAPPAHPNCRCTLQITPDERSSENKEEAMAINMTEEQLRALVREEHKRCCGMGFKKPEEVEEVKEEERAVSSTRDPELLASLNDTMNMVVDGVASLKSGMDTLAEYIMGLNKDKEVAEVVEEATESRSEETEERMERAFWEEKLGKIFK